MPQIVTMPEVLAGAEEATLLVWRVAEGDTVEHGTVLAEVETDKATIELPASAAGTVGRLLVEPDSTVAVGAPLVALLGPGETVDNLNQKSSTPVSTSSPSEVAAPRTVAASTSRSHDTAEGDQTRRFVSPLARRLVRERGLDPASIEGTGPNGRITRRDVERATATDSETVSDARSRPEVVPHSRMRRAIARRLTEATTTIPHFSLRARCRVGTLLELRSQINAVSESRISVNDLVIRAVAIALRDVPEVNVRWTEEGTERLSGYDVGVAVSTSDGLLVPVVRDVLDRPLGVVAQETAALVDRARGAALRPDEMTAGSMTVSNLGMHGISEFAAIINPPQSAILAVGAAERQVIVEDEKPTVATVMTVTLSVDHRLLDGAAAARWLRAFVAAVECPVSLLI